MWWVEAANRQIKFKSRFVHVKIAIDSINFDVRLNWQGLLNYFWLGRMC